MQMGKQTETGKERNKAKEIKNLKNRTNKNKLQFISLNCPVKEMCI